MGVGGRRRRGSGASRGARRRWGLRRSTQARAGRSRARSSPPACGLAGGRRAWEGSRWRGTPRPPRATPGGGPSGNEVRSSYSISAAMRPRTAYSTLRSTPVEVTAALRRQPIAHLTLPSTSHQRRSSGSHRDPGQLGVPREVGAELTDSAETPLVGAEAPRADDRPGEVLRGSERWGTPSRGDTRGRARRRPRCRSGSRRG